MARSWQEVKGDKERIDREAGRDVDAVRIEARLRTQAYVLGFRLARLRQEVGLSQTEIAGRMGVSQPRVSQLESGDIGQLEVDTLSRYVTALGGRLRLVADFDDHGVDVSVPSRDELSV